MKIKPRPFPRSSAEKLIQFLPYFKEHNTYKNSDNRVNKDIVYGIYDKEYSSTVNQFIELCNDCFVAVYLDSMGDWELSDISEELIVNPEQIANINLLTLRMLFANLTYVKYEDFQSAMTIYIMNSNIIVCMLLRLKELIQEIAVVTKENEQWLNKIIAWADEKGIEDYHTTPNTQNIIWGGLPRDKELLLNSFTLQIGWNDIGELPKEIGNLTNLIELRVWCSKLTKLPKEIGNLVNLRELSLVENNLMCLPKEIGNLINLEVLWLDTNSIKELPKEIGNLENLRELRLTENNLVCLPKEISNLINLEELSLDDNPITELPKEINILTKLKVLGFAEKCEDKQIKEYLL